MSFENPLMAELMVPRDKKVAERIEGFYNDIGWDVHNSISSAFFKHVSPQLGETIPPTIAYWQTENQRKLAKFAINKSPRPSMYARGWRLPELQDLVEIWLVVPSDETVHKLFNRGGALLESHAHIPPREHEGRQEFRFSDPFNYSLRVTADPGYSID